jgi:cytochrome c
MKIQKGLLAFLWVCIIAVTPAMAADTQGTRDEAKAMVDKAVALFKQDSKKAIDAFNSKEGGFIDRDLYIFVIDDTGTTLANGAKPALAGQNVLELTDVTGFAWVKAFLAVKDSGWVDYKWANPVDKSVRDKSSYIVRVGDKIIGCGYYK